MGNNQDWQEQSQAALRAKDFDRAEEILVEIGEQPSFSIRAASAINTLAYSILIPQKRFEEARLWLQDAINMEAGYESWNARSNLGLCEFFSGNIKAAERYFKQVIAAKEGPIDEAEEYLARIKVKDIPTAPKLPDLHYSDEWKTLDVSGPADMDEPPRYWYLRLIKYMDTTNPEFDLEDFDRARGACATGFANGALEGRSPDFGLTRDAAVKAYVDYIHYKFKDIDEDYAPREFGERLIDDEEVEQGMKHLRLAAGNGDSKASLRLGELLYEEEEYDEALPWLRVAVAQGEKSASDLIDEIAESGWLDNDDFDDEEDED